MGIYWELFIDYIDSSIIEIAHGNYESLKVFFYGFPCFPVFDPQLFSFLIFVAFFNISDFSAYHFTPCWSLLSL